MPDRPEDFVSAEYRADLAALEREVNSDIEKPPPVAMQLVPLGVLSALIFFAWYLKKLKLIKSGLHKKRDDDC